LEKRIADEFSSFIKIAKFSVRNHLNKNIANRSSFAGAGYDGNIDSISQKLIEESVARTAANDMERFRTQC
jgi:hypothetical protein